MKTPPRDCVASQCFDRVVNAVMDGSEARHFFLQGAGGTGKTFLYRAVYYHLRATGKSVLLWDRRHTPPLRPHRPLPVQDPSVLGRVDDV
jgi:PIF1-like helicase